MKQLTSYNRAAGYLNKLFNLLNDHFFEGELSRPTITIQSTPKAYGHFSTNPNCWISANGGTHEINIGAGTLARPVEELSATLLHEACHLYCYVHQIKDTSRGGTYHNSRFKQVAESHGLIVDKHPKYGWTITSPSEELLDFILENELTDILLFRNEFYGVAVTGPGTHNGTTTPPLSKPSNSKKYQCPCCKNSVRATKVVNIVCGDCGLKMELA